MPLRNFPLLKDMGCGSLKNCRREGWFCVKCHFSNKTCFRFGTIGLYCVTNVMINFGRILRVAVDKAVGEEGRNVL